MEIQIFKKLRPLIAASYVTSGIANGATAWDVDSAKILYSELGKNSTAQSLIYAGLLSDNICPANTRMMKLDGNLQVKIVRLDNGKLAAFPNVSFRVNNSKFFARWYDTEKLSFKYQDRKYKIGPIKCFNQDGKEINFRNTENDYTLERQALYGLLLNQQAIYVMLNSDRITKYFGREQILNIYTRLVIWRSHLENTVESQSGTEKDSKNNRSFYRAAQIVMSIGGSIDNLPYNPYKEHSKYTRLNYVNTICYNKGMQSTFSVTRYALPPADLKKVFIDPICIHKTPSTTVIESKDSKTIPLPKPRPKDLITIDPAKNPTNN